MSFQIERYAVGGVVFFVSLAAFSATHRAIDFQAHVDYATGSGPIGVVVADFNRDGNADLATSNEFGNTVTVLLGNGDGTMQTGTDYAAGRSPSSIVEGDFNGDGKADLAVSNALSNDLSVLVGNGDGTFQAQ